MFYFFRVTVLANFKSFVEGVVINPKIFHFVKHREGLHN